MLACFCLTVAAATRAFYGQNAWTLAAGPDGQTRAASRGLELTRQLLNDLAIGERDEVVEFAPGLGVTARMALARKPCSYTAIERDREAASTVGSYLAEPHQQCIVGTAEQTGLPNCVASVVYGEAMLSMQTAATKSRIVAEAARLLTPGGRTAFMSCALRQRR